LACRPEPMDFSTCEAPIQGNQQPPSDQELAAHEVVGWILGAVFAMYSPERVDEVPSLLAKSRGNEVELMHDLLVQYLGRVTQEKASPSAVCPVLLRGLHAYCADLDNVSLSANPQWSPETEGPQLVDAFVAQVVNLIQHRATAHISRNRTVSETKAQTKTLNKTSKKRQRTSSRDKFLNDKENSLSSRDKFVNDKENSLGLKAKVPRKSVLGAPEKKTLKDSTNIIRDSSAHCKTRHKGDECSGSEEEWPEGNGACEGCGRFTYGCEVWGPACVILCAHCRKAKSPMMWALTTQYFRLHSLSSLESVCGQTR